MPRLPYPSRLAWNVRARPTALLFAIAIPSVSWMIAAFADTTGAVRTAKPLPCPGGRFVAPAGAPLVVGGSVIGPDAVIVDDGQVGIASGCGATPARLRGRKNHVVVKATWLTCGTARRVRLKARIEAPSCTRLTGRVKAKGARAVHFTAVLAVDPQTTTSTSVAASTSSSSTSSSSTSSSSTSSSSTSSSTTTSSTTSTTCITCEAVLAECGELDTGCGTAVYCGDCPADRPTCLDAHCYPVCATAPNGTPCEYSSDRCTHGACNEGFCELSSVTSCQPTPCYTASSCIPATGACEPTSASYVGDGASCAATLLGPLGFCHQGTCDTSIACWINDTPWPALHPSPANPFCEACLPGFNRTAWSSAETGKPCPGGLCVVGVCEDDICLIDGVTYDVGDTDPLNACRSCQPGTSRRTWTTVGNGGPCPGGACVAGSCDPNVCVIAGTVHPAGATNPSNECQKCDPAGSRTTWTALPDNSVCGSGCLVGTCQAFFGCTITGTSGCPSTDCSIGFCDTTTGQCQGTPRNQGGACSQLTTNGCQATEGTCDALGSCIRPALAGQTCIPALHTNLCRETDTGICDATGHCVPDAKPSGTDCRPAGGGNLCAAYTCTLTGACRFEMRSDFSNICPTASGCSAVQCEPSSGICYADPPDPSGTRVCENVFGQSPCCWGQTCRCPPGTGQFCVEKFCYSGPPL